ncbi:glycosyl hydrolase family 71-domain-containing protein [Neohortaea acidophila]|uniref:Glycosyl hydrolase family 71-domain-containing protein n=1 Tax=Neohortaea acidophila TaxID=245834 RepID=A0A6A6PI02_9PEZI|nr:glycosyl hydrolase family 71-domain-containing protein [Neohortaea acidophila]KAF2479361.1 glycosyl hydrolase family 71-domain-containing protein [Neohortaea acidophila]
MAAWLPTLLALLGFAIARAEAQHVFAHVLVGTTVGYTVANWQNDIQLAASFGIEAFALNIGTPLQGITATQVANAFQAAAALNTSFQLFFSFDYLGGTAGAWQTSDIVNLLQNYTTSPSYFQYQGRPFVSTFEGPTVSNVNQWSTIRSSISGGIYFVPDWSSQGPGYNMNLYDGAFSWTMWPDGPNQMTTAPDQQWTSSLTPANKTYMMGVSPWFYTDLPAYNKAWVWRGDRLWFDRWQETQQVLPQFVEIVSWNDWGECHYVSPIYQPGIPNAPNADATVYVDGYPHSAWLQTLPYQIAAYKHAYNSANPAPSVPVGQDKIVFWYRTSPAASGSTDCTGNCAQSSINTGGYQTGYPPSQILEDNIFAIALLSYPASVSIAIGNNVITFPNVPAGINLVNRTFGGFTGPVTVKSSSGAIGTGVNITSAPASGVANFNAFVGLASHYYWHCECYYEQYWEQCREHYDRLQHHRLEHNWFHYNERYERNYKRNYERSYERNYRQQHYKQHHEQQRKQLYHHQRSQHASQYHNRLCDKYSLRSDNSHNHGHSDFDLYASGQHDGDFDCDSSSGYEYCYEHEYGDPGRGNEYCHEHCDPEPGYNHCHEYCDPDAGHKYCHEHEYFDANSGHDHRYEHVHASRQHRNEYEYFHSTAKYRDEHEYFHATSKHRYKYEYLDSAAEHRYKHQHFDPAAEHRYEYKYFHSTAKYRHEHEYFHATSKHRDEYEYFDSTAEHRHEYKYIDPATENSDKHQYSDPVRNHEHSNQHAISKYRHDHIDAACDYQDCDPTAKYNYGDQYCNPAGKDEYSDAAGEDRHDDSDKDDDQKELAPEKMVLVQYSSQRARQSEHLSGVLVSPALYPRE